VATVTIREPVLAVELMVMLALALVALLTVTELTVMPAPKFVVVTPCRKFV
jgi:hypothetical protein